MRNEDIIWNGLICNHFQTFYLCLISVVDWNSIMKKKLLTTNKKSPTFPLKSNHSTDMTWHFLLITLESSHARHFLLITLESNHERHFLLITLESSHERHFLLITLESSHERHFLLITLESSHERHFLLITLERIMKDISYWLLWKAVMKDISSWLLWKAVMKDILWLFSTFHGLFRRDNHFISTKVCKTPFSEYFRTRLLKHIVNVPPPPGGGGCTLLDCDSMDIKIFKEWLNR